MEAPSIEFQLSFILMSDSSLEILDPLLVFTLLQYLLDLLIDSFDFQKLSLVMCIHVQFKQVVSHQLIGSKLILPNLVLDSANLTPIVQIDFHPKLLYPLPKIVLCHILSAQCIQAKCGCRHQLLQSLSLVWRHLSLVTNDHRILALYNDFLSYFYALS